MEWLKDIRRKAGLTCEAIGSEVGITQQYYNFIENGKRRPSVAIAKRIAAVLGFDWTRFFEHQDTA